MKQIISALTLTAIACINGHATTADSDFRIVPIPKSIELQSSKPFILTGSTVVSYQDNALQRNADFLTEYIKDGTGITVTTTQQKTKSNAIQLELVDAGIEPEGYRISVNDKKITISATDKAGIFYGIQTLRKSLPYDSQTDTVRVPSAIINDHPRMSYRGMLLDCGRHFFPVEDIKIFIDILALHNMNIFHWHLTEDQGWRFEVKKYPELTEIGSKRRGTEIGWCCGLNDNKPYGGYYTQDDCREIVSYAADRNITVIPEIDMPGHTQSLLACFPEAGCTGGPYEVSDHWGVHEDILCAGSERTFEIVEDILDEVCDVFPSAYINIGGDEAPKTRWQACPKCQQRISDEGIKASDNRTAESALQGYFTKRVEKYLNEKGRKIIGWNEILESGANASSGIMNRYGEEATVEAAKSGHNVIVNTTAFCYFDYPQRADLRLEPKLFPLGFCIPISRVYQLEPIPAGLTAEEEANIIGVQANVWGEFISNIMLAQYQMLPRMAATCETQWIAPGQKVYHDFMRRLPKMTKIYDTHSYVWCHGLE